MLLVLGDGTRLQVTELPGDGPWTFLVLHPDLEPPAGPAPEGVAGLLTRFGRVVVPDLRGRPGWGEPPGAPRFLDLVDDLDQVRTRAGLGRPVLVGLGDLAPVAARAAAAQPWAWRALILGPAAARPGPAVVDLDELDLPVLIMDASDHSEADATARTGPAASAGGEWLRVGDLPWEEPAVAGAVERLLGRLGGGPGWAGIAPDAPPR